jgi:predicted HTH domain antitoxin
MADEVKESKTGRILEQQNIEISPKTQEALNKPLNLPEGLDQRDREFLDLVVGLIQKGAIKLFEPASLMNHPVYDRLSEMDQGKAELDAYNMLSTIRDIYRLWQAGEHDTYQISNLVHKIRVTKERLEQIGGDIYIL